MSHHTRSVARGKLQTKGENPTKTSKAAEGQSSSKFIAPKKEAQDKEEYMEALRLKRKPEVKSHEEQKKLQEIDKRKEIEIVERREMEIVKSKEMEIVKRKEMDVDKNKQNSLSASMPDKKFHTVLDDMGNLVGFSATK